MNEGEPCVLGDEAGDGMWIDEVRSLVIVPFWREAACNMHETGDSICGSVRRGAWGAMWALCPLTHVLHSLTIPHLQYLYGTHSPGA